tara:strand:- start:427 stop:828 length:402 start_codon:yes stop_codon:yes gene_type:complete
MKRFVFLVLLLFSSSAYADTSSLNLQLPNSSGTHSSDKFKSGDMDCSNAIDGSTKFEFGVTGLIDNYQSPFGERNGMTEKDVGVFARIVVPLDGPAERINCNTLYQLELKKKRLEIEKLERELSKLRSLQTAE